MQTELNSNSPKDDASLVGMKHLLHWPNQTLVNNNIWLMRNINILHQWKGPICAYNIINNSIELSYNSQNCNYTIENGCDQLLSRYHITTTNAYYSKDTSINFPEGLLMSAYNITSSTHDSILWTLNMSSGDVTYFLDNSSLRGRSYLNIINSSTLHRRRLFFWWVCKCLCVLIFVFTILFRTICS